MVTVLVKLLPAQVMVAVVPVIVKVPLLLNIIPEERAILPPMVKLPLKEKVPVNPVKLSEATVVFNEQLTV
jgi:hypothetical protein